MRRFMWILLAFAAGGGSANAQAKLNSNAQWDLGASAGLLSANPNATDNPYGGDWYFSGRYAVSIGRYWTSHLKSELEIATTNEGERYVQRYANAPGVPTGYSYTARERHTLRQVSGRAVWQFFDNTWVHPYVFGGVVYDADRVETFVSPQYYYPDPRSTSPQLIVAPPGDDAPRLMHRFGVTAGAGAKFYMTPSAFFNAALVVSHAKPATAASVIGGFGIDF